jgi:hypothetical protein
MNSIDYYDDKPLQMSKKNHPNKRVVDTENLEYKEDDHFQFKDLKDSKENAKIDNTNYLLEDSFGMSYGKNPYTISAINRKFNNTQNLLTDKTSILLENVSRGYTSKNKKEKSEIFSEGIKFSFFLIFKNFNFRLF